MAPGPERPGVFVCTVLERSGIPVRPSGKGRECPFALFRNGRRRVVVWDNCRCVPPRELGGGAVVVSGWRHVLPGTGRSACRRGSLPAGLLWCIGLAVSSAGNRAECLPSWELGDGAVVVSGWRHVLPGTGAEPTVVGGCCPAFPVTSPSRSAGSPSGFSSVRPR